MFVCFSTWVYKFCVLCMLVNRNLWKRGYQYINMSIMYESLYFYLFIYFVYINEYYGVLRPTHNLLLSFFVLK